MAKAVGAALRNLSRARAFTTLVVLTLALGIGTTTTMFSVVDAVLITPIPFPNAERMTEIWVRFEEGASRTPASTGAIVGALREQSALFDVVAAYQFGSGTLTGAGDPEMLSVPVLSTNIFSVFPVAPLAGRLFTPADASAAERVVLISERFWARRFGRDASVVGKVLTIDDVAHRVVGVLPVRFSLPETDPDVWRIVNLDDVTLRARVQIIAMRKSGVTRAQVDDRLKTLSASLQSSGVLPTGQSLITEEPLPMRLGRSGANALYLLLGAVAVLLLVACVNVSNLMLVRASSRSGELALMAAIGAGRSRLLRDAAIESVLLAAAGGALGVWLASGLLDVILSLTPDQMRMLSRATGELDTRAVLFAILLTLITCVAFGMFPAWRASRIDPLEALKQQSRSMAGRRDDWWQGALVSTQIALVVVLLAGAGLLLTSFIKLNYVDLGFDPNRLATIDVQLTSPRYAAPGAALSLMREIENRVESQLGTPVTISTGSPIRLGGFSVDVHPEAEGLTPPPPPDHLPSTRVSPDFFDVYQIPILEGHTFTPDDGDSAVILNEIMAKRYFGNLSPIGRRFKTDTKNPWLTVVGVVGDVKTMGPSDPMGDGMEMYIPYSAVPRTYNFISLTAAVGPNADRALAQIKRIVWDLDSNVPILAALSLREQVGDSIARPRFILSLSGAFTICAVLIAAIGVYGVSAYWVARRRREMAIRMALGASPDRLMMTVVARSLKLAAVGTVVGLAIAFGGASVMQSLLFATDPRDPTTFIAITILLAAVAVGACAAPALKAARVDPMTTLRAE
ncbi:MAG TPA: ADOP family duplicated permease [Vicinamibacterales bacterium]|nr:ADOP family duplicated permease [Vicinamibacterales bacterium]